MSVIGTVVVAVSLLSIVMAQVLNIEDRNSIGGREESQLLAALNGVSHALESFGDILNSQAEKNNNALESFGDILNSQTQKSFNALESFGDLLRDSVRLRNQDSDTEAEVERLRKKVDELTREIRNQKMQLAVKDQKVLYLEKRLNESQKLAENLAEQVKRLNSTAATESSTDEDLLNCGPEQENVKKEVEKYIEDQDWEALRTGLATVLEHYSPASMQLQNITGYYTSPLYEVVKRDYQDLVKLLLCHGLPVDIAGRNNFTMLHAAVESDNTQLVKLLLHCGADANSMNINGELLLLVAAKGGSLDIVQMLVRAGADTNLTNFSGYTAKEIARMYGNTAVVLYLAQIAH